MFVAERPTPKLLEQLGERLRELRAESEWSQAQLAERSGLHRTYVAGLETCRRNPSLAAIEQLAAAFALTPSELLDGVVGKRKAPARRRTR